MQKNTSKLIILKLIILFLCVDCLFFTKAHAASEKTLDAKSLVHVESFSTEIFKQKMDQHNWFFYFGAGIVPQPKFDSQIQSQVDDAYAQKQVGEYGGILEIPGIYKKYGYINSLGASFLYGVLGHLIFENYSEKFNKYQSLGYDTYSLTLSGILNFSEHILDSYFIRFDFGPAQLVQIEEYGPAQYRRTFFEGMYEQLSFGYAFQSSSQSKCLLNVGVFYEDVIAHFQTGIQFNIGFIL